MSLLTCNQTGGLSISLTCVVAVFITCCYILDSWDIMTYKSDGLINVLNSYGYNVTSEGSFYVITANSSDSSSLGYALPKSTNGGMWKSCSVVSGNDKAQVQSMSNVEWIGKETCLVHESMGASRYPFQSGRYIKQMMTRTAQSCMLVSCICLLACLILGTTSLVIKHVILSMVSTTVCYASGVYQLFTFVLMTRRHGEANDYLDGSALPVNLDDCVEVQYGNSAYLAITGFVVALVTGTLWIIHTNTLRGAIKLYIAETKYNLWCRT